MLEKSGVSAEVVVSAKGKQAMKSGKIRNAFRAGAVLIAIMLFGGLLVSSPQAAQPWKVASVSLVGADGANNNMAFAYDR